MYVISHIFSCFSLIFLVFFLLITKWQKYSFSKRRFWERNGDFFSYYSSPNDLSCSSWYSNAILSSKASDTSWCNSFMVRATTELFSRISWILHCKARQSLLIPVKETILDIRECSTRGGNWKIKYVYYLKEMRLQKTFNPMQGRRKVWKSGGARGIGWA